MALHLCDEGTRRPAPLIAACITFLLLGICCGSATTAQESSKLTPKQSNPPPLIRLRTNVIVVRVVVTDVKGNPVGGLKQSDFRLFDNKRPQAITYFSAEVPPAAAPALPEAKQPAEVAKNPSSAPLVTLTPSVWPRRFTALFFDDYHMQFNNLGQIRDAAKRYLEKSLDQGARVAIFTASGRAHVEFTNDPARLEQAVTKLQFDLRFEPPDECPPMTDLQAQEIHDTPELMSTGEMAGNGVSGRKASPHPESPTSPAAIGPLAVAAAVGGVLNCPPGGLQARASYIAAYDNQNAEASIKALAALVQRMAQTPGGQRTIAMVSEGFLNQQSQVQLNALIDRALRAKVIINALDANGLYNPEDRVYAELIGNDPKLAEAYANLQTDSVDSDGDVMALIAEGTGGTFIKNNNDFEGGLAKLSAPYTAYVLGFSPANFKFDGNFHTLKVKLANQEGYIVHARHGYFAPKHAEELATAESEELEQAVFSEDHMNGFPVRFNTQFQRLDSQTTKVSVTALMDTNSLGFRKENGRNLDDVTFELAVFDEDGNYVAGQEKTAHMHLSDALLKKLDSTGATITAAVSVKPGAYLVRGVLLDAGSQQLGSGSDNLRIP